MAQDQINQTKEKPAKKKTTLLKIIIIIFGLLLALLILKFILLIIAYPTISIKYIEEFNKISRPDNYDPNQNAAPYYKKAFASFWELPSAPEIIRYPHTPWPEDVNDIELETVKKWIALNSKALIYLEQATSKPYYWEKYWEPPYPRNMTKVFDIMVGTRHTLKCSRIAVLLDLQTKFMFSEGKTDLVLENIIQLHKMGAHLLGPKTLAEQLAGKHIKDISVNTVFEILDRQAIDTTSLKEWQQKLEHQIYQGRKEADFENERFLAYFVIQRIFTDNGRGKGHLIPRKAYEYIEPPLIFGLSPSETEVEQYDRNLYLRFIWLALTGPDRRKTVAMVDKFFAYVDTLKDQTPWQLRSKGLDSNEKIRSMLKGYVIEEVVFTVYAVIELYQRLKANESALITTISILRYKEDKRQLPGNLDQLVSTGYLKNLPMDPYSDASLVYKRIGDDFILYSLGADFDDDGGVYSHWGKSVGGGDQVFWPVEKRKEKTRE